jgi:hypothetical protein
MKVNMAEASGSTNHLSACIVNESIQLGKIGMIGGSIARGAKRVLTRFLLSAGNAQK